jgi:hypothetical protein
MYMRAVRLFSHRRLICFAAELISDAFNQGFAAAVGSAAAGCTRPAAGCIHERASFTARSKLCARVLYCTAGYQRTTLITRMALLLSCVHVVVPEQQLPGLDNTGAAGTAIAHLPPGASASIVERVSVRQRSPNEKLPQFALLRACCGSQELSGSPEAPGSELRAG